MGTLTASPVSHRRKSTAIPNRHSISHNDDAVSSLTGSTYFSTPRNSIGSWRRLSSIASSLAPPGFNTRRTSVPFPVTDWRSSKDPDVASGSPRGTRGSSDGAIEAGPRKLSKSWRVSLLVSKAGRRLSRGSLQQEEDPVLGGHHNTLRKRLSLSDFVKIAAMKKPDAEKRRMIRILKQKAAQHKKVLLAKFRRAVKLTIFCARNFKEHCLRINENQDELAPYIQRLHFHDDAETDDLLIDLSKFKANRQLRIPDETKRILSMEVGQRTDQEIYQVVIALRNIKCFSDYPARMQKRIAEVGLYEKYESKRMIVRQGHPASGFYFILSGAVVVMVMDEDSKYARPVAHLYKGQTFGELAIINRTHRQSTVIAKETCEFLSISVQNYHKIFMSGGMKTVSDPDQEVFLKGLSCLAGWPIPLLQQSPSKCQFLFFKNADIITRDSHYSDWIVIIKSGSVQVLKKLKKVEAYEWKRKPPPPAPVQGRERRELQLQQAVFRRVLPELQVPLLHVTSGPEGGLERLDNGRPPPFVHPDGERSGEVDEDEKENQTPRKSKIPNLWPFHMDVSEVEYGRYLEDDFMSALKDSDFSKGKHGAARQDRKHKNRLGVPGGQARDRSNSVIQEEESELLGFQPHIRTIMEDIDAGIKRKEDDDVNPADMNPEFVHVQTLTKGQVFGLADVIIGDQPSFSLVSKGADCLLLNKHFYLEHASEKLLREMRQELCPYPSEEELQERLQVSVDWQAYKRATLASSLERMTLRRHLKQGTNGGVEQEAC